MWKCACAENENRAGESKGEHISKKHKGRNQNRGNSSEEDKIKSSKTVSKQLLPEGERKDIQQPAHASQRNSNVERNIQERNGHFYNKPSAGSGTQGAKEKQPSPTDKELQPQSTERVRARVEKRKNAELKKTSVDEEQARRTMADWVTKVICSVTILGALGIIIGIIVHMLPTQEAKVEVEEDEITVTEEVEVATELAITTEEKFKGTLTKMFHNATDLYELKGKLTREEHIRDLEHKKEIHEMTQQHDMNKIHIAIGTVIAVAAVTAITVCVACTMRGRRAASASPDQELALRKAIGEAIEIHETKKEQRQQQEELEKEEKRKKANAEKLQKQEKIELEYLRLINKLKKEGKIDDEPPPPTPE